MRKSPAMERLRGIAYPADDRGSYLDFYRSLPPSHEERIARVALGLHDAGDEEFSELLRWLAAFSSGAGLRSIYPDLLAAGVLYPPIAWRFGGDQAVPRLASRLGREAVETDHALQALAWCRSDASVALFEQFRRAPPSWSSLLHWPAHKYTETAGWQLDGAGGVRQLYRDRCVPVRVAREGDGPTFDAWRNLAEPCGFCGRPLVSMLAGAPPSDAIDVATCHVCSCFGNVFSREGATRWVPENERPSFLPESDEEWDLPRVALVTGSPRPPLAAADELLPISFSQIGGHPTWIQDPDYPTCIRCGEAMTFVAQVDRADLEDHGEGVYHAFRCAGCGIAATSYQQT